MTPATTSPNRLENAIQGFAKDPTRNGKLLREALETDPGTFVRLVVASVTNSDQPDAAGRGVRYALMLLGKHDLLIPVIAKPGSTSLAESLSLTRLMLAIDPAFLNTLVDGLFLRPELRDTDCAIRILDLVAECPSNVANWRVISRLYDRPDPRVRSKCATLLAKFRYDEQALAARFDDAEPRVRANLVEALWASDRVKGASILRRALADTNNRVAGNACLAMYNSGEVLALSELSRLLESPFPEFRVTAAWVMGKTRDPRFRTRLVEASRSNLPELRTTAVRSLGELDDIAIAVDPPLDLAIAAIPGATDPAEVWIRVLNRTGNFQPNLRPLDFFLYEDAQPVLDYSVTEVHETAAINLRIAWPSSIPALINSLSRELPAKPRSHEWAISVYGSQVTSGQQLDSPEMTADPVQLNKNIARPPGTPTLGRTIRSLLRLPERPGCGHLLVLVDGPDSNDINPAALAGECVRRGIRLHLWRTSTPGPDTGLWATSGVPIIVLDDPAAAWPTFMAGLSNRYALAFQSGNRPAWLRLRIPGAPPTFSNRIAFFQEARTMEIDQ
jgi:hypothetical protein